MRLSDFFKENMHIALAFSGGVDSAYLLYEAVNCGADVTAYYVKSEFQPEFELRDALRLIRELNSDLPITSGISGNEKGLCRKNHVNLKVLEISVLSNPNIAENSKDRCYYCKKLMFETICKAAAADGYTTLIDGTNASDDAGDRPGMKALREMSVRSPLRECGLTKDEIRRLSEQAGLFTWDKPAYACLATRIPHGERITPRGLETVQHCENFLYDMGFRDFRIRVSGENYDAAPWASGCIEKSIAANSFPENRISGKAEAPVFAAAKIQLRGCQHDLFYQNQNRIFSELKKYFSEVTLDSEVRP